MASAEHTHSIHVDAPVEKVFGYIEDPAHFLGAMPEKNQVTLEAVHRVPDGTVATYQSKYRQVGMHRTIDWTREEYVPDERIVDRASLGIVWKWTVEPDATGTTLTLGYDTSRLMEMLDKVFFHGDKEVDGALAKIRQEIEALP